MQRVLRMEVSGEMEEIEWRGYMTRPDRIISDGSIESMIASVPSTGPG